MDTPNSSELLNPALFALKNMGGSASLKDIEKQIVSDMEYPSDIADGTWPGNPNRTAINYLLAWALTYLKLTGYIEKAGNRIWQLTQTGIDAGVLDPLEVKRRANKKGGDPSNTEEDNGIFDDDSELKDDAWKEELLEIIRGLTPGAFERLCQKVLYSSGFEDVEVTGRSGDGGVDGKAIFNLNGLLSYRVFFQCKKYASDNKVGPDTVRDLRSPITTEGGNIAKGLIITTSGFTKGAEDEAKKGNPIDLMNGLQLAEKMRALGLGGNETFAVRPDWFQQFEN